MLQKILSAGLLRLQRFIMLEAGRGYLLPNLTKADRQLLNDVQWITCAPGLCALKKHDAEVRRLNRQWGAPL